MSDPIVHRPSSIVNVLVVGGSGYVANLILPLIADQFNLHIFDQNPPAWATINHQPSTINYIPGDVTDPQALQTAAQNKDLLLYMAMGRVGADGINVPAVSHD